MASDTLDPIVANSAVTNGVVAVTVTITESDMLDGLMLTAPSARWSFPGLFALVGLAAGSRIGGAVVAIVSCIALATLGWFVRKLPARMNARRAVANKSEAERTITWRFSEAGIDLSTAKSNAHVDWSALHRFLDGPRSFVFYPSEAIVYVIPKRSLAAEQVEPLRTLFAQRIVPRKRPSRVPYVIALWVVFVAMFLAVWFIMGDGR